MVSKTTLRLKIRLQPYPLYVSNFDQCVFVRYIIVESDAIFIKQLYQVPAINFAPITGLTLAPYFMLQPFALKLLFDAIILHLF